MKARSKNKTTRSKKTPELITTEPSAFFKEQLGRALEIQKIKADPTTESYVVDLLMRFMFSDNLYAVDEKGGKHEEVLAILLNETMTTGDAVQRRHGLRRIGDVSLYTAGFFGDSLARKIVDIDYYIGMGRNAYGSLASMGFGQKLFGELADKFSKFVDALGEISSTAGTNDPKNILRLYELWLKTRSERAEKTLKEAGIIPTRTIKPDWQ